MAELKVNASAIDALIDGVKTKENEIDASVRSISSPNISSGIKISEYYTVMTKLSELMNNYKELLDKDMNDIQTSKNKLVEMDSEMKIN